MKPVLSLSVLVVGIVLLLGSVLWAVIFPPTRVWTEEKSIRLTELGDRATALQLELGRAQGRPSMHSGRNAAEIKTEFEKVDAEYNSLYQDFVGASESSKTASKFMRYAGIAFIVAGAMVVMATRGGG